MKKLSEKEYKRELEAIKKNNIQIAYKKRLKYEKQKYKKKFKFETSKLIAIYLFALLNAIVVYAMVAMWHFVDLSYLGILISDIAAQVIIYAIYCLKAYKSKKSEEDMKFKKERYIGTLDNVLHSAAESTEYLPIAGTEQVNQEEIGKG